MVDQIGKRVVDQIGTRMMIEREGEEHMIDVNRISNGDRFGDVDR